MSLERPVRTAYYLVPSPRKGLRQLKRLLVSAVGVLLAILTPALNFSSRAAREVQVAQNRPAAVVAQAGIRIDIAEWVPKRDQQYGWWGVVRAGESPKKIEHRTNTAGPLLLSPGRYDVYWKQGYYHQPLLLRREVKVAEGQLTAVSPQAGIRLEVADWVPWISRQENKWTVHRLTEPTVTSARICCQVPPVGSRGS